MRDQAARERWGCREPTPQPQFEIDCVWCRGVGCGQCVGGYQRLHRCPNALVAEAEVLDLVEAVQLFKQHSVLPIAAGWLDQTYAFVQALRVVEGELAAVRAERERRGKRGGL